MVNFSDVLNKTKKIQEKMKAAQESIKKIEVEGISGGGLVKICLNGNGDLIKIFIDKSLMLEKKEILEDLIQAAHFSCKEKLKTKTSEELSKVAGGLDLPPEFKLPF